MENKRKSKEIFKLLVVLFCLFLICIFWLFKEKIEEAKAGEGDNVFGWAWSENFGWFSANCSNLGTCPGPGLPINYGLNIDAAGAITGYLWAEHIGWVKFGGTGAPGGQEAFYDKNTGKVTGWAKILTLGDDGWLKLRGSSVGVGSGPYRKCAACKDVLDEEGVPTGEVICNICFKSELYGGSGNICSNCSGCTRGAENTCNTCTDCDAYGVAIDGETGRVLGWAWNGNVDPAVGVGWMNFSPTPGGLILASPWLETKYGEIYARKEVRSPSAFVEILNKYNATYCILTNGTITHFRSEKPEPTGCAIEGFEIFDYPKTSNLYTNIFAKIDLDGILAGKYGEVVNINNESEIPNLLGGKIYYHNGDLTINAKMFSNGVGSQKGNGLIVVKGNLTINGNITYQGGSVINLKNLASVGWLVLDDGSGTKGNVTVNPGVENFVGAFYVESELSTGTTGDWRTDKPLTVRGLILAKKFKFQRAWQSAQRGSEQVIYDGRVLANTPPGMIDLVKALPIWREAAP